ncbi:hypothetical protein V501_01487 [Pseudogymnoascus sp. VKM F-4519 (FW-2642)]|nr:hypothetical protein V501_01487 [Pseudogymnoascus sp. VKM F-4519 (FW-2642)]OBT50515.1 hypothetical protein VE04_08763 [Pseudogymnoascus sp. 24MN13]
MSNRTKSRVTYDGVESFFENGRKVDEIIEKDTGRPVIQTKSLPPFLIPVELTESAINQLKAFSGVKVEDVSYED